VHVKGLIGQRDSAHLWVDEYLERAGQTPDRLFIPEGAEFFGRGRELVNERANFGIVGLSTRVQAQGVDSAPRDGGPLEEHALGGWMPEEHPDHVRSPFEGEEQCGRRSNWWPARRTRG
jgi:hypothetical protein